MEYGYMVYGIWDIGHRIWDVGMGYGIWDIGQGMWDMGIWDIGHGMWVHGDMGYGI